MVVTWKQDILKVASMVFTWWIVALVDSGTVVQCYDLRNCSTETTCTYTSDLFSVFKQYSDP